MNIVNDKIIVPEKIAFRENVTAMHIKFFAGLNGSGYILTEDNKLIDLNIDRNGTTS